MHSSASANPFRLPGPESLTLASSQAGRATPTEFSPTLLVDADEVIRIAAFFAAAR